jgi:GcrA cell cycle regulator
MAPRDPYTDADKARLVELWHENLSLAQIAETITKETRGRLQLTKNAVRGKLYRMGICGTAGTAGRPNPIKKHLDATSPTKPKKLSREASRRAAQILPEAEPPKPPGLRLIDGRQATCSWPTSSGHPWTFCGLPAAPGRPYCVDHCGRAYVGTPKYPLRGFFS